MSKMNRRWILAGCGAASAWLLAAAAPAFAAGEEGEGDAPEVTEQEAAPADKVSANITLALDTNFMSYGFDVWQRGTFDDALFHPQFDIKWLLPAGFNVYGGIWSDINNNESSSIGDAVQEVDLWAGIGYGYDIFSVSLTYQEWMYANDSERIVDLGLAADTILQPNLTIHGRVHGNGEQDEGVVFVPGIGHTFEFGSVTLNTPVKVGFVTNDYYKEGEGGFGYVSVGGNVGVPLSFIAADYGTWGFNTGLTYYYADRGVVGNQDDNILTGTMAVTLGF